MHTQRRRFRRSAQRRRLRCGAEDWRPEVGTELRLFVCRDAVPAQYLVQRPWVLDRDDLNADDAAVLIEVNEGVVIDLSCAGNWLVGQPDVERANVQIVLKLHAF